MRRERVAQHWFLAGLTDRAAQAAVHGGDQANEALMAIKRDAVDGAAVIVP